MKRLLPWALLAASLAANVALAATLGGRRDASGVPSEPLIFSRVQLDADQRARIASLRAELLARREESEGSLAALRRQLATAIARQPEDRAVVGSTLHQIAEAQASFQEAVVNHVLAVRSVLKPDQRPAFEDIIAHHMQAGAQMHCGVEPTGDLPSP
jgi:Spy/CpxP family protein refolding chaperone